MLGVDYYPGDILPHYDFINFSPFDLEMLGVNYPSESFTSLCFWLGADGDVSLYEDDPNALEGDH